MLSSRNVVLQALILSVTLFTVTINGMVTMVGTSALASLYADDIVIYCGSQSIVTVEH
jgi:hypothetical protein